jgi:polyisoprenoid-binding protein YceI
MRRIFSGASRSSLALALLTGLLSGTPALADDWSIDTAHSSAGFSIGHMMISNVRGTFSNVTGKAVYDGKNIEGIKVDAKIDIKSVNTGDENRDKHLLNEDFFDATKYPHMTFVSKKAIPTAEGSFDLVGDLSIHGKSKEVTLKVDGPSKTVEDHKGRTKVGATASTEINRNDFGISGYPGAVGDKVKITLDIELFKDSKKETN